MIRQLQQTKKRFSERLERTARRGAEAVTRRAAVVVVVAIDAYRRLQRGERDFAQFVRSAPHFDDLDVRRSADPTRLVEL